MIHDKFEYSFVDGSFNHYFTRLAFLDGWKNIVPPDKQVEVFELVEERINKKAQKHGVFKLGVPFVVIDSTKKQMTKNI